MKKIETCPIISKANTPERLASMQAWIDFQQEELDHRKKATDWKTYKAERKARQTAFENR